MIYRNAKTREISFPLGGIGAGCIGLAGNGMLIDWEIFNRPNKNSFNGISHFAVRAEKAGRVVGYRLLNGDLPPSYTGKALTSNQGKFSGFGFGPAEETMANWPHFRKCVFRGEYPFAHLDFSGETFPAKTGLTAWSVLIPGNAMDSSLPAAFFEIEIANNTSDTLDYTAVGVLNNPWASADLSSFNKIQNGSQLTVFSGENTDRFQAGDITLTLSEKPHDISYQEYFYRGGWRDHQETYYHDVMAGGRFKNRTYSSRPQNPGWMPGLLAAHFRLRPGAERTVKFLITWNIPQRKNDWDEDIEELRKKNHIANSWKNYYATIWRNSSESGLYAEKNYEKLRGQTKLFHDELFASSLPKAVLDGISANISLLKSPTCLLLEDGTFYGWEGVGSTWGSCEGSCSHVWNYAQTLPFLFPELEKSMRESHLKYSIDEDGGSHFRLKLPLGIKADKSFFRPCADGQFGDVMKIYRDWKITGDTGYVRRWWKKIRKTIEYAWSSANPDKWDPRKTGILTGRQHHTLDMELFGPNAWLTGHYLGALKAGSLLAEAADDLEFAEICRKIYEKGRKYLNEKLFNGEYFQQEIDLKDRSAVKKFGADGTYWDSEHNEIKYQISNGCGIDSVLAQGYAYLYGLGEIFDFEKDKSALQAIWKYNYKPSMRDTVNLWRMYSLNDESGVMICSWPRGNRPVIPIPYNSETMHGFEWSYAYHLVFAGMTEQAQMVAESVRSRYDGEKRNPWNEIECGSNYARSMAAYGLLNAYAGFAFDARCGMLAFSPKIKNSNFRTLWCLGKVWGSFRQTKHSAKLIMSGEPFTLKKLELEKKVIKYRLNGKAVELKSSGIRLKKGDALEAVFAEQK